MATPPALQCPACLHPLSYAPGLALIMCPACSVMINLRSAQQLPPSHCGITACAGCGIYMVFAANDGDRVACSTCHTITQTPTARSYVCRCGLFVQHASTLDTTICTACKTVRQPEHPYTSGLAPLPPTGVSARFVNTGVGAAAIATSAAQYSPEREQLSQTQPQQTPPDSPPHSPPHSPQSMSQQQQPQPQPQQPHQLAKPPQQQEAPPEPQSAPKPAPQTAPQPASQPASQPAPQPAQQPGPQPAQHPVPQPVPQQAPLHQQSQQESQQPQQPQQPPLTTSPTTATSRLSVVAAPGRPPPPLPRERGARQPQHVSIAPVFPFEATHQHQHHHQQQQQQQAAMMQAQAQAQAHAHAQAQAQAHAHAVAQAQAHAQAQAQAQAHAQAQAQALAYMQAQQVAAQHGWPTDPLVQQQPLPPYPVHAPAIVGSAGHAPFPPPIGTFERPFMPRYPGQRGRHSSSTPVLERQRRRQSQALSGASSASVRVKGSGSRSGRIVRGERTGAPEAAAGETEQLVVASMSAMTIASTRGAPEAANESRDSAHTARIVHPAPRAADGADTESPDVVTGSKFSAEEKVQPPSKLGSAEVVPTDLGVEGGGGTADHGSALRAKAATSEHAVHAVSHSETEGSATVLPSSSPADRKSGAVSTDRAAKEGGSLNEDSVNGGSVGDGNNGSANGGDVMHHGTNPPQEPGMGDSADCSEPQDPAAEGKPINESEPGSKST